MPAFNREGVHCIQFQYHMYGFHIRTLQVVTGDGETIKIYWTKTGQQGILWNHAQVNIQLWKRNRVNITIYVNH